MTVSDRVAEVAARSAEVGAMVLTTSAMQG